MLQGVLELLIDLTPSYMSIAATASWTAAVTARVDDCESGTPADRMDL